MTNIPDNYISPAQAATILGVSPIRVRQFCLRGRLVAIKAGRDWFIDPESVQAFATIARPRGWKPGRKRKG